MTQRGKFCASLHGCRGGKDIGDMGGVKGTQYAVHDKCIALTVLNTD